MGDGPEEAEGPEELAACQSLGRGAGDRRAAVKSECQGTDKR